MRFRLSYLMHLVFEIPLSEEQDLTETSESIGITNQLIGHHATQATFSCHVRGSQSNNHMISI